MYPTTILNNVGIGTTEPSYPLSFGTTNQGNCIIALYDDGSGDNWYGIGSPIDDNNVLTFGAGLASGDDPQMVLSSDGYVGINTTTPSFPLDVNGNVNFNGTANLVNTLTITNSVDSSSILTLSQGGVDTTIQNSNNSGTIFIKTKNGSGVLNNTISINSSSGINIGTNLIMNNNLIDELNSIYWNDGTVQTTAGQWINGPSSSIYYASGNVGIGKVPTVALDVSGNVNATSYNTTSDYRIKKDVITLGETFTVDNLNPVTYNNINIGKQDIGLIAHELQEFYPFLVNGEKDGENFQSVNYTGIIGILIKEIKELKKDVKLIKENIHL